MAMPQRRERPWLLRSTQRGASIARDSHAASFLRGNGGHMCQLLIRTGVELLSFSGSS
jgi:hypothetical protein